ncbi:MAG: hypothetical protein L3J92_05085 [Thermoplasmata archaeon]|nr:hypothetical protein [Thermoplasmata archaeon]
MTVARCRDCSAVRNAGPQFADHLAGCPARRARLEREQAGRTVEAILEVTE